MLKKKSLLMAVVVMLTALTITGCGKKVEPQQAPTVQNEVQVQNPMESMDPQSIRVNDDGYNPEGNIDDPNNPNALDYMAPGHRQARERLQRVKELRQQALDIQKEDMEKLKKQ